MKRLLGALAITAMVMAGCSLLRPDEGEKDGEPHARSHVTDHAQWAEIPTYNPDPPDKYPTNTTLNAMFPDAEAGDTFTVRNINNGIVYHVTKVSPTTWLFWAGTPSIDGKTVVSKLKVLDDIEVSGVATFGDINATELHFISALRDTRVLIDFDGNATFVGDVTAGSVEAPRYRWSDIPTYNPVNADDPPSNAILSARFSDAKIGDEFLIRSAATHAIYRVIKHSSTRWHYWGSSAAP